MGLYPGQKVGGYDNGTKRTLYGDGKMKGENIMKTMKKLCKYFEKVHPGWFAVLDTIESHKGWYIVYIDAPGGFDTRYTFTTCAEFKQWIDGVILD